MTPTKIEWYSKEEAGVRLGSPERPLSPRRVLELAKEGRIESERFKDPKTNQMTVRIRAGSVERFLDDRNSPSIKEFVANTEDVRQAVFGAAREFRAQLGQTQKGMAKLIGLSLSSVCKCEGATLIPDYFPSRNLLFAYKWAAQEHKRLDLAEVFRAATNGKIASEVREVSEPQTPQGLQHCESSALAELVRVLREGFAAHPAHLWLTLSEAVDYSGLPAGTLLELILSHRLPALDVGRRRRGGRWRIRKVDLRKLDAIPLETHYKVLADPEKV